MGKSGDVLGPLVILKVFSESTGLDTLKVLNKGWLDEYINEETVTNNMKSPA